MSSRERLDMDNDKRGGSKSLTFKQRKGYFIERRVLVLLVVVTLCVIVIVGLLAGFLAPCAKDKAELSLDNGTLVKPAVTEKLYVLLPRSVVPEHYIVELQPYVFPPNFTFDGSVNIRIKCTEETSNVTLHVNDLVVHEETVKLDGVKAPNIQRISHDAERQFFIMHLDRPMKAGDFYNVSMTFRGNLNDQLAGFYRSSYETSSGEKRWLATTQFQPTDARRAFPCFDEPALKAKFDITLVRLKNMTAISNMPQSRVESRGDDWEAVVFKTTVPMSTYLLAFIICDYKSKASTNMKVWTREEALPTAEYALTTGTYILDYYQQFFNISYPLPKMDMISIPDFSAGAMENWGLITYRETALLYDPKISSAGNKQRVASVVSHELAHQWFGNLVTPQWWDDLWLNEGFASYVENIGVQAAHPDWEMHQQFVVDDLQDVLELDSLKSSHPISVPVNNPDEINEIFDSISYGKGASVIRMMNYFLGNDTFRRGLTNYLRNKTYGNAVQDDLWRFLTDAQTETQNDKRINVKEVMDSWTLQTGYPVVTVTRDYHANKAMVTQVRFLVDGSIPETMYYWEVPITYTDAQNPDWEPKTKLWLHKKNGTLEKLPSNEFWIVVNLQQVGYYRVNYDLNNWKLLIEQLQSDHQKINVVNRAQILDDALDLARARVIDYELALNTTLYLNKEEQYVPWEAALNSLSYLSMMLSRSSIYGKWKKYIVRQLEPLYKSLGWNEDINTESILTQYLRINVLLWMCKYDYPDCVAQARNKFQTWKSNSKDMTIIPPNFRSVVYCTAIRHGGQEDWDFGWEQYKEAKIASEKDKLMKALACSREPWLLSRYLEWSITPTSGIRKQDGSYAFRAVASNLYGRDIAFNYFRDRWEDVHGTYGKSFFAFSNLVSTVTNSLNTQFELDQLRSFYESHKGDLGTAQRAFKQAIEGTEANVLWMSKNFKDIKKWLDAVVV